MVDVQDTGDYIRILLRCARLTPKGTPTRVNSATSSVADVNLAVIPPQPLPLAQRASGGPPYRQKPVARTSHCGKPVRASSFVELTAPIKL